MHDSDHGKNASAALRPIRIEGAAADGLPLYIGHGELQVRSPDGRHHTRWVYDSEPPHGDSLNALWLDDVKLPGLYWGRGHAWSANDVLQSFCTAERFDAGRSTLCVIRATDRHWLEIARQASIVTLRYPDIVFRGYGESQALHTITLTGRETWRPIPP
ncbi:MAG: hypothetical protein EOO28_05990 [Comamonadaceae bacterium]|nr:MAG: hypothetical protein EOO28_05990 [Comamonadaceae bacterium]